MQETCLPARAESDESVVVVAGTAAGYGALEQVAASVLGAAAQYLMLEGIGSTAREARVASHSMPAP